jgi:hypothetical protein
MTLWHLAVMSHNSGDFVEARKFYDRALPIYRKFLGDDHPTTRTVRRNLEMLIETMSGEG